MVLAINERWTIWSRFVDGVGEWGSRVAYYTIHSSTTYVAGVARAGKFSFPITKLALLTTQRKKKIRQMVWVCDSGVALRLPTNGQRKANTFLQATAVHSETFMDLFSSSTNKLRLLALGWFPAVEGWRRVCPGTRLNNDAQSKRRSQGLR